MSPSSLTSAGESVPACRRERGLPEANQGALSAFVQLGQWGPQVGSSFMSREWELGGLCHNTRGGTRISSKSHGQGFLQ